MRIVKKLRNDMEVHKLVLTKNVFGDMVNLHSPLCRPNKDFNSMFVRTYCWKNVTCKNCLKKKI